MLNVQIVQPEIIYTQSAGGMDIVRMRLVYEQPDGPTVQHVIEPLGPVEGSVEVVDWVNKPIREYFSIRGDWRFRIQFREEDGQKVVTAWELVYMMNVFGQPISSWNNVVGAREVSQAALIGLEAEGVQFAEGLFVAPILTAFADLVSGVEADLSQRGIAITY